MSTYFILQKETIASLQDSQKKLNELSSTSKDRLDSFGKLVACTLRNQAQEISSTLMKEITNMMLSNAIIKINLPTVS